MSMLVKQDAEDCEVDTLLYGEKFTEKLMAAKSAEKSSKELVKQPTKTTSDNYRKRAFQKVPRRIARENTRDINGIAHTRNLVIKSKKKPKVFKHLN
ncbi:uncharacterized protein LOC122500004 isoform X2 [Leptopilina heterotoma]|uniref:uncharacterized protein LOC122500004 isoform X2 n=1 Tax=Leptopilina heterotoma TaxID=63436 RepID=UPI001CA89C88|nr:uncharacterized protein LOC122500004 isoform X2 [Leptopilina heterotoma]